MNNKITFPRLATLLADRSGRSKRFSEDFLREFFSLISERLEAGESVKIKGLGTFKLSKVEARKSVDVTTGEPMEISGHSKVVFLPAKELAAAVNSPFEAFTAIEISDDADITQLFKEEDVDESQNQVDSIDKDININKEDVEEEKPLLSTETSAIEFEAETASGSIEKIENNEDADNQNALVENLEEEEISEESFENHEINNHEIENHEIESNVIENDVIENSEIESNVIENDVIENSEIISEIAKPLEPDDYIEMEDKQDAISDIKDTEDSDSFANIEMPEKSVESIDNDKDEEPSKSDDIQDSLDNIAPDDSDESGEIDDFQEIDVKEIRKSNWKKGIFISLIAAICALIATFAIWYVVATNDFNRIFNKTASTSKPEDVAMADNAQNQNVKVESTPAIATDDSIEDSASAIETEMEAATTPSDPIVYDTISTTRYLTTMAKAHYGNYNLWPFIYEENKAKLGHPDRIRPGTPVVIPKLSKYGVDPSNPADVEKAKKMGVEIYSRYGKSI